MPIIAKELQEYKNTGLTADEVVEMQRELLGYKQAELFTKSEFDRAYLIGYEDGISKRPCNYKKLHKQAEKALEGE